jgi:LacI family transcriptional regulator
LIKKGHRRIGCISNNLRVTPVIERLQGYEKALEDHGIEVDHSLIQIEEYSFENGYRFAQYFLNKTDVTALFVADNLLLMGAMEYFQHNKIPIPDRLAIIGFDDFEWERITTPPLSVVKQPAYELGEKAAEVMLKRLSNKGGEYREYRLPTELIIRQSF